MSFFEDDQDDVESEKIQSSFGESRRTSFDESRRISEELPKIQAMKFITEMFSCRGYDTTKNSLVFDHHLNMWKLFSETELGEKVMAVFADCKPFGDAMEISEFNPISLLSNSKSLQTGDKCKINPNQNTGMDFVKSIIKFSLTNKLKIVILITDFMTTHAFKHIANVKQIRFLHFSYEEANVENMSNHIMQPVVFQRLKEQEKNLYIQQHPRYKVELQRYSINDLSLIHI